MVLADPTSPWKTLSSRLWVTTGLYVKVERRDAGRDLNALPT